MLLAGCAGLRVVDSAVQSYSALESNALASGARFRFERLPLANTDPVDRAALEAWTARALERAGLRPAADAASARYTVQVSAGSVRYDTLPWADPWPGWGFGIGFGFGPYPGPWYRGVGPAIGAGWDNYLPPTPRFQRRVEIVLREAATGQVVYQSRAVSDSSWWDEAAVLPAMIDAALQGFPAPPAGVREVRTPLPNGG